MKKIFIGALFATVVFIGLGQPQPAAALSCMDPAGMIDYYVAEDEYVIFIAKAGETQEFIKESAQAGDPNRQFASGYTGQYVEVVDVYKGYPEDKQWVYYQKNSTWGYMCAGGPADPGADTLYVVSRADGMFGLPQVVNSYPADSTLAGEIIKALEAVETDNVPTVNEMTAENWQERLRGELSEMIFLIRIKFAEFIFWAGR